jgi:hypothetical protein
MKVALAPRYQTWMLALVPLSLGLGTAFLWLRSLDWPLDVNDEGLIFRNHRQVMWSSITKIGVSRHYRDGHVSEIRIHSDAGINRIPAYVLRDGQKVVSIILAMFEEADRARSHNKRRLEVEGSRNSLIKTDAGMLRCPPKLGERSNPENSRATNLRSVGDGRLYRKHA